MTLNDLLKIQKTFEKRAIPSDILESDFKYYSVSKDAHINLLDLHLTHFIRIFLQLQNEKERLSASDIIFTVRERLKSLEDINS
tara:strand:- start:263 stop:514 length:252 start_codon:yes stop_codon:yes gene_type:complete